MKPAPMEAAIFFSGKFGSTKTYAHWIREQTQLPVFDLGKEKPDPDAYDTLVLGTSIIASRPSILRWVKGHWDRLKDKKLLLFTVSGAAPDDPNLQEWLETSLGRDILGRVHHVALRGKLVPKELPVWIRLMLKMASKLEKDPEAKKRMTKGFDHMSKASIAPIVTWVDHQKRPLSDDQSSQSHIKQVAL